MAEFEDDELELLVKKMCNIIYLTVTVIKSKLSSNGTSSAKSKNNNIETKKTKDRSDLLSFIVVKFQIRTLQYRKVRAHEYPHKVDKERMFRWFPRTGQIDKCRSISVLSLNDFLALLPAVLHDSWLRNIFCEQWMVQTHHTPPC
jgi:hypothetical protein